MPTRYCRQSKKKVKARNLIQTMPAEQRTQCRNPKGPSNSLNQKGCEYHRLSITWSYGMCIYMAKYYFFYLPTSLCMFLIISGTTSADDQIQGSLRRWIFLLSNSKAAAMRCVERIVYLRFSSDTEVLRGCLLS